MRIGTVLPTTRRLAAAAGLTLLVGAVTALGAGPALADETVADPAAGGPAAGGPVAGGTPVGGTPQAPDLTGGGTASPAATIEDEEDWCSFLTGVYVRKPTYYTVRTINCRYTDVFVRPVYLNGTFGTCVLVPARHSRHLGGSVLKPMEESRIC